MLKVILYIRYIALKVFLPVVVLIFFFLPNALEAQSQITNAYEQLVDSLIEAAPKTYHEINGVMKPVRSDTVYMNFMAKRCEERNYLDGQTYALNQLGRKYRDISNYPRSLYLHQQAQAVATAANNLEFEVYSLNMVSVVFRKTDAIKSSLEFSQQALALAETVNNPNIGLKRSMNVSNNNIGNIYQILEQYDLAIGRFEKSITLDKELKNDFGLAVNYQNIGECYEAQGRLKKALENLETSLTYNQKINSDRGKVICKYSIAHVYVHQNKEEDARALLESILPTVARLGDNSITASVYNNLGWTLTKLGNYKEAEDYLLKGREIATQLKLVTVIGESNKFLSELWVEKGDFEKALKYYKLAGHFEKVVANEQNLRYVNDLVYRYAEEQKNNTIQGLEQKNEITNLKLRQNEMILLIVGIVFALLGGIFYVLYRQYQLKNEKKVLTLEQNMLRSQMNPHFLFNSLNSIKLYIINNEQKNAVHYLNKFSKLVRKILEASSYKEIALAEELETVELYMNIEDIRFSNEINFKISVDEKIDSHLVKIPSLILQPFLENALWHGLSSKKGEKKITLHVGQVEKGTIQIIITDNGIGRAAAEKIKEGKVLQRKSVGIDITKERLENFAGEYKNSYSLHIEDLYEADGSAAGTKVILVIPTV